MHWKSLESSLWRNYTETSSTSITHQHLGRFGELARQNVGTFKGLCAHDAQKDPETHWFWSVLGLERFGRVIDYTEEFGTTAFQAAHLITHPECLHLKIDFRTNCVVISDSMACICICTCVCKFMCLSESGCRQQDVTLKDAQLWNAFQFRRGAVPVTASNAVKPSEQVIKTAHAPLHCIYSFGLAWAGAEAPVSGGEVCNWH